MKSLKKLLIGATTLFFFSATNGQDARHVWMPIWNFFDNSDKLSNTLQNAPNYNTIHLEHGSDVIKSSGISMGKTSYNGNVIALPKKETKEKFAPHNTLDIYGDVRNFNLNPVLLYSNGKAKPVNDSTLEVPKNTLCPLKIKGAIRLDATLSNIKINIKSPVVIEPSQYYNSLTEYKNKKIYSINFITGENKQILVDVQHDLIFRSLNLRDSAKNLLRYYPDFVNDLFLIFTGKGKTIFQLSDGSKLMFQNGDRIENSFDINQDFLISPTSNTTSLKTTPELTTIKLRPSTDSLAFMK